MNNSPILITGMYRSGTTLLSRILNSHDDLSITYDSLHFMRYYYNKFGKKNLLKKNIDVAIDSIIKRIQSRTGKKLNKNNIKSQLMKKKIIYYNFFYQTIMFEFLINGTTANNWGEKTNIAWSQIPNFLKMFVNGKIIFLIRDPRDILISYKKMSSYKNPEYLDCIFLNLGGFQFLEKYKNNFIRDSILLIKYEDLVSHPNTKLKEICNFLNIKFSNKLLNFNNYLELDGTKWKPNTSFNRKIKTFSKKPIGRWKKNILNEDLFLSELVLNKFLKKYNYNLSNTSFSEKIFKKTFNKISKSKNLTKRFEDWIIEGNGQDEFMYRDWN